MRAQALTTLADVVECDADELARLDADDNGSLLREMRRDVDMAVFYLRYYAGLVLQLHGETVPSEPGTLTYSLRQPFGVVGRLIPFNHPLMFAPSKIAAPLVAGNTVVIKPTEHTTLSALASASSSPTSSRPACSTSSPARARARATRSSRTPTFAASPSRGPPRRGAHPGRAAEVAVKTSPSSSAARTRWSSSPMPTSTRP